MKEAYYCPSCKKEVEVVAACGATNYFCNFCKRLISSKQILREQDMKNEGCKANEILN